MLICQLHYAARPCEQCAASQASPPLPHGLAAPAVIVFKEAVFEHMYHPWERPVPISTPERLRDECNARGVTSEYLRDSGLWRSGPRRWV